MKNLYASCSENKDKALEFVKNMKNSADCEFFAFSVIKDGKTLVKCAPAPYDTSDNAQVYSLSKSFCSTAAGFAFDEGLWKPGDRLVDVFPESVPEVISENLAKVTMGDVLSMSCGHENCSMSVCINSPDPIKAFMEKEFKFVPGTHFAYNTGATFIIAAMVEKLTGESVIDYLDRKLFVHLGVRPGKWQRVPNVSMCKTTGGICEGGVGLYVSLDCIEAFGQFILNKGVVDGKQLLSREWIDLATSKISDNSCNGTKDWCAGYGYQFWRNAPEGDGISHGGFRGDGAFGQLCMVFPEHNMTVCCRAKCGDMQKEVDYIVDFAFSLNADANDGEGVYEDAILDAAFAPQKAIINGEFSGLGKTFRLCENHQHFTNVRFEKSDDGVISVVFSNGERFITIPATVNSYTYNYFMVDDFKPTLLGLVPERYEDVEAWSCLGEVSKNTLKVNVRFRNCPHKGEIICTIDKDDGIKVFLHFDAARWSEENEISLLTGKI